EVGTLSNEDGSFSIKIPENYLDRELILSSIGYEKVKIRLHELKASRTLEVTLTEKVVRLDEITVTTEKFKKKKEVLGNGKPLLLNGFIKGDTLYAGSAAALLIDKREFPELTYIQEASLYIAINKMPAFKVRMRLMAVDSANDLKPGEDILYEQVLVESSIRKGWLTFPLKEIHQIEEEAFYLTFEWILDKTDRQYIHNTYQRFFEEYPDRIHYDTIIVDGEEVVTRQLPKALAGTFFGISSTKRDREKYKCYTRSHSFGTWDRSSSTLSAKITLTNYPVGPTEKEQVAQPLSIADSLSRWITEFREEQNIPGLQLAAMKGNELIYSNAFGYSDKQNGIKASPTTQFRIASVSKPITAAGLMKLVAQGKMDLDASVYTYAPSFPKKNYPITSRQLLGHLGGIRDYYEISLEDEVFIQEHYSNANEALAEFKNDSLVAKPGTLFNYSSFGYTLLGAVIEGVTGQSYLDYMQHEVWKPLNMIYTYGDIADSTMANKSTFYFYTGEEASPYDLSYKHPSGGLVSTAEDLVRFGSAVLNEKLLDQSFVDQMFAPQYTNSGEPTGYGLGWYIGKDANNNTVWYHAGELPSTGSILVMYPEKELVIALLTNSPIISDSDDGFSEEIELLGEMIYEHKGW
ncbi:MAG: serine hydrolase, partial [Bacteroidota bacterium]